MEDQFANKPIPRTGSGTSIVFARVASFVFHPLLMTAVTALSLYKSMPDNFSGFSLSEFRRWFAQLLLYTVLLPLVLIFIFRITGLISNTRMHKQRDRIFPLLATIICYLLGYRFFLAHYRFPPLFQAVLLGCCCATIVVFFVNFFYKVSIHTTAAAIFPGIYLSLMLSQRLPVILPLLVAGLVAITVGVIRWLLGAHTIGQILLGYAVGAVTQSATYFSLNT